MIYQYNDVKIEYKFNNFVSSTPILLLHGWGCDAKIFADLIRKFPEKSFLTVDLPPFGKSGNNISDWSIFTYVNMLISLFEHLNISKCDVLGHSFGGRLAILLSSVQSSYVHSCILVDSAGLRPKRKFDYYLKILRYKYLKKHKKDIDNLGSKDYLALSPRLRKLFNKIVNTNLDDYCKNINIKTLIVWGEKDKDTQFYMAKRLNKLIKKSELKVIKNAGHYSFIEHPFEFYSLIKDFWEAL